MTGVGLAGLIIVLVLAVSLYLLIARTQPKSAKRPGALNQALVRERWQIIETQATSGPAGLKQAVGEADKLLDYVMKARGYSGQTMAERLKRAQSSLSDREAVWQAHKLRNAIAHEVGYDLVVSQARHALEGFKQALKDLGAL
jgi:hypothetical protein